MTLPWTCLGCAAQRIDREAPCARCGQLAARATREARAIAEPMSRERIAAISSEAARRSHGDVTAGAPHEMNGAQLLGACARAIEELLAERDAVAASPEEWAAPEVSTRATHVEAAPVPPARRPHHADAQGRIPSMFPLHVAADGRAAYPAGTVFTAVAPPLIAPATSGLVALLPAEGEEPAAGDVVVREAVAEAAPVERCAACHRDMTESVAVDGLKVCPPKKCGNAAGIYRIALAARAKLLPASYRRDGEAAREALRLVERVVRESFQAAAGRAWVPAFDGPDALDAKEST